MPAKKKTNRSRSVASKRANPLAIPGARATETGLRLPPTLTEGQWLEVGHTLARLERASRWLIGDWINFGRHRYGEGFEEAAAQVGLDPQSVQDCAWVARAVPITVRHRSLSWSVHRVVAPFPARDQQRWLAAAERHHWSVRELRAEIGQAQVKQLPRPGAIEGARTVVTLVADSEPAPPTVFQTVVRALDPRPADEDDDDDDNEEPAAPEPSVFMPLVDTLTACIGYGQYEPSARAYLSHLPGEQRDRIRGLLPRAQAALAVLRRSLDA